VTIRIKQQIDIVYLKYAAVTRSRIGAHHLPYQEPDRILAVERAPIRGARLSDGNVAGSAMRATAFDERYVWD
jgi:hypothetical protein